MNESLVDLQLKQLTRLCLASENYTKIAEVVMNLISNRLDEIGIRLGIKPRDKIHGESMCTYTEVINSILKNNFEIELFPQELLEKLQYYETFLKRRKKPLELTHIDIVRTLIHYYYELRKLDVPDVYQTVSSQDVLHIPQIRLLSFLSGNKSKAKYQMGGITPLVMHKIRVEERNIEQKLHQHYDPELFEKLLQLKTIRKSFQKEKSGKISVEGALKDNINYFHSKEKLIQFFLIGWVILLGMLGIIVLTQTILFPLTAMGMSPYLLIIFGACFLLILIYRYYIKRGGGF